MSYSIDQSLVLHQFFAIVKANSELFWKQLVAALHAVEQQRERKDLFPIALKFTPQIVGLEEVELIRAHRHPSHGDTLYLIGSKNEEYFLIIPAMPGKKTRNILKIALWLERRWVNYSPCYTLHGSDLFKLKHIAYTPEATHSPTSKTTQIPIEPNLEIMHRLYPHLALFQYQRPPNQTEVENAINLTSESTLYYLITPFINALTLQELMNQGGPLSANTLLFLWLQITHEIFLVHLQKCIVKDIKPDNILVGDELSVPGYSDKFYRVNLIDLEEPEDIHTYPLQRSAGSTLAFHSPAIGHSDSPALIHPANLQRIFESFKMDEDFNVHLREFMRVTGAGSHKLLRIHHIMPVPDSSLFGGIATYLLSPECRSDVISLGLVFLYTLIGKAGYDRIFTDALMKSVRDASTITIANEILTRVWSQVESVISQSITDPEQLYLIQVIAPMIFIERCPISKVFYFLSKACQSYLHEISNPASSRHAIHQALLRRGYSHNNLNFFLSPLELKKTSFSDVVYSY